MAMAWIWTGMVVLSLIFGVLNGTIGAVSAAAMEGARAAVELCFSMAGILCLWSGVMAVMERCGLTRGLSRLFAPLLRRLMPNACRDRETLSALSANLSCNLLGLGNAATPLGIQAARRMARGTMSAGGDEHRLHPTPPHHYSRCPRRLRRGGALRHPPGGMAGLGAVGNGRGGGGKAALPVHWEN